ncbi:DUF5597 domain-containing protein [Mycetocola zhujimingii]|nr:DUF5597 domain-containing protein [Mycetocola zhujimingii]
MTLPSLDTAPVLPRIESVHGRRQLIVDERPFLILGGELHNSSGSETTALLDGLDRAVLMNANTALVPVTWELVEPVEGTFDFSLVEEALNGARERGLRLILLWFGTWKNGRSSYVPSWVKSDLKRFPRAVLRGGRSTEHISPFSDEAANRDAEAFARLMDFLASADGTRRTVVMVQVENEVGLLGDSRDRSNLAEQAFEESVPERFFELLASESPLAVRSAWEANGSLASGTWSTVFGGDIRGDEAFMAHAYASFVERVAAAGSARYPLPLFTNAWLDSEIDVPGFTVTGGQRPGTYPSGGPIAAVAPVWRTFAPTLDLVAPDIYVGDFDLICGRFSEASDGALLIPEMRRDQLGAGQMSVALGAHAALGVSPFGIDSGEASELDAVADLYALIAAVADRLTVADRRSVQGFHLGDTDESQVLSVGNRRFRAGKVRSWGAKDVAPHTYGIIIQTGPLEFLAIGRGFVLEPLDEDGRQVGILSVDELTRGERGLVPGRRLNGDETLSGSAWVHPSQGHAAAGGLPIPSVGENSGITMCKLYEF